LTGLFLHFGSGPNKLPEPWQNLSAAHDIRKPLQFGRGEAHAVLAEHVVEHVSFQHGLGFFWECMRVLEPGGVLRIAFPDLSRFLWEHASGFIITGDGDRYARALYEHQHPGKPLPVEEPAPASGTAMAPEFTRKALLHMATGWGHQTAWTYQSAAACLLAVGFSHVRRCAYGWSPRAELAGVDGHHRDVGLVLAHLESTILEATKDGEK
jgi:hypothetical protein